MKQQVLVQLQLGGEDNKVSGTQSVCIGGNSTTIDGDNCVCIGSGQNPMTMNGANMNYMKGATVYALEQVDLADLAVITGNDVKAGYIELPNGSSNTLDTATNVAAALGLTAASFTTANSRFIIITIFAAVGGAGASAFVSHSTTTGWAGRNSGNGFTVRGASILTLILNSVTTGDLVWTTI